MPATLTGEHPRRLSRRAGIIVVMSVAALGVVIDQITKHWALGALTPGAPVEVWGDLLRFTLLRNSGAAFSLGEGLTPLFTVAAMVAMVAVAVLAWRRVRMPVWAVVVGLFGAGVAGNLIDRLIRPPGFLHGHVIDFLQLPHWPVFNVADMCLTTAAVLVVLLSFTATVGPDGVGRLK